MPDAIKRRRISSIFKWLGRIGSIIVLGGVMAFYIGEGGFNPFRLAAAGMVTMALFWLSCAGLVVGWKWEGVGGAISILSMLAFFIAEFAINGRFPAGYTFEVITLPGIFYILAASLKGKEPPAEQGEERVA